MEKSYLITLQKAVSLDGGAETEPLVKGPAIISHAAVRTTEFSDSMEAVNAPAAHSENKLLLFTGSIHSRLC